MMRNHTNILFFSAFTVLFISCKKSDPITGKSLLAEAQSIMVHDGNVLVSGYRAENGVVNTVYWVNGKNEEQASFLNLVQKQSKFKQAIDDKSRIVYSYKDAEGLIQNFQFDQGSMLNNEKIFYYKNDLKVELEDDTLGNIASVDFLNDKPFFGGYLGEVISRETGEVIRPITPFVWDGSSTIHLLFLPEQTKVFHGVNAVYIHKEDEFYLSAKCNFPIYWKNNNPILLDNRYGEVWQVTKVNNSVYAVGFLNKHNSNSTGHTACYWKNGILHELEDHAQAYGIYINGEDVYVCGSTGSVPTQYRPCYWKNGKRQDLPN